MIALKSLLLAIAGFGGLSLSMHRHARQAVPPAWFPRAGVLRWAGWSLLILSLAIRMIAPGWRIGLVEWIGQAGLAAALIVLVLIYCPRLLPATMVATGVAASLTIVADAISG